MFHFHKITKEEKEKFLSYRAGETRLGQKIRCYDELEGKPLTHSEIRFVLVGVPEDIGVRANYGIGGTDSSWIPFLKSFLNIQESASLSGSHFQLYGCLRRDTILIPDVQESIESLREQTENVDDLLFPIIQEIIEAGKIPIVIGGGHNNAFPILKGASLAKNNPINALNIDAHADFRAIEGRHSGNAFSYAFLKGHLKKYFVLGLHEAYNSIEMMQNMADAPEINYLYWENIFLRKKYTWDAAIQAAIDHVAEDSFGAEMDVDCIENTLSSAATPVGILPREAMDALYECGKHPKSIYLHIPEAIANRSDGLQNPFAGKMLSYLVQAFTKGVLERKYE